MVTPDDGHLPLPVRVRPAAGETAESYIRCLAQANHLRPSLLQVYVRNPDVPTAAIRLRRLAAVSGSTRTALASALTGLTPASQRRLPPPRKRGTRPAPAIGPVQDVLDKLAGEPLAVWEIWTTVTDQHDSDASYAAIRDYIRSRRLARQSGSLLQGDQTAAAVGSR